jgi:hypothetical protein
MPASHCRNEALLAFGNRSTVSSTETDLPAGTGILAASDWIEAQFHQISAACGNCLEVKVDDFLEQPPTGEACDHALHCSQAVSPLPERRAMAIPPTK